MDRHKSSSPHNAPSRHRSRARPRCPAWHRSPAGHKLSAGYRSPAGHRSRLDFRWLKQVPYHRKVSGSTHGSLALQRFSALNKFTS
ncbi:hypothetical protein PoB_002796300 [Plakobranchus ocellatus]|uniref:Uncharacterized protein n=1 Tax=Plakobranchus ocellatus TaxID=259542 RepID=A0AAV4A453_9GAST|nr:hypothetical protein PoB_002796300 [Plakobranchus ocellatus]